MLVPVANEPRDYAWGSTTLLAALESRTPTGRAEAEVWFGDHPADPSETADGRTLDVILGEQGGRLPYLLKLLAAGSALSIQAHPSKAQAEAGFAREEAAGIARDSAHRTYRDDNHKPELIVAVSERFRALAGLRDLDATRRLVAALGDDAREVARRLDGSLADLIAWLLSPEAAADVLAVIKAAEQSRSDEFVAELALVRDLNTAYPGDPGVVVAMLMNLVTLRRGEGLFVPAGVLHAYLDGLGVELMAASDNVLRGGLTPKHIDVDELLTVLDPTPGQPRVIHPAPKAHSIDQYDVPVDDFTLTRVRSDADSDVTLPVAGPTIALVVEGVVTITGAHAVTLRPGGAVFVSADEGAVALRGRGEVFIASPGSGEEAG